LNILCMKRGGRYNRFFVNHHFIKGLCSSFVGFLLKWLGYIPHRKSETGEEQNEENPRLRRVTILRTHKDTRKKLVFIQKTFNNKFTATYDQHHGDYHHYQQVRKSGQHWETSGQYLQGGKGSIQREEECPSSRTSCHDKTQICPKAHRSSSRDSFRG